MGLLDSNNGSSWVKDQHRATPIPSLWSSSLNHVILTSVASILLHSAAFVFGLQAAIGYSTVCFFKLCRSSGSGDTWTKIYVHTLTRRHWCKHTNFFYSSSTFPVFCRLDTLANTSAEDLSFFWSQTCTTLRREHHLQLRWHDWISAWQPRYLYKQTLSAWELCNERRALFWPDW